MLTRLIQFVFLIIPLSIFLWLVQIEFVPTGQFFVSHSPEQTSPYIDGLVPQDRVRAPEKIQGTWVQAIIDDPVYFFLHPHRQFDHLTFEIWFKNTRASVVEFGGLVQTKPDVFDLRPLHHLLIDQLHWPSIEQDGLFLYQNPKRTVYESLEAFYQNPPPRDRIAVYKADYSVPFRLSNYVPSASLRSHEVSLRGKHELKTYIKNETLDFTFVYMDMNRDEGADPVVVTLFNERGQPVTDARAQDDGQTQGNSIPSRQKVIRLQSSGLTEGVYKIVVSAPRDIFFRKLETFQQKFVFLHTMFFGDEIGYREEPRATTVWSAAERFQLQTRHATGVQEVTIGKERVSVAEPYKWYTHKTDGRLSSVNIPKGDLEIFFDGPLALEREAYFQPDLKTISQSANVDYVLTSYQSPHVQNDWLVQTIEVDTKDLVFDKKAWKFTFSAPGVAQEDGELLIKQINTTWTRQPFTWQDLWNALW